jgi:hypothetical protein
MGFGEGCVYWGVPSSTSSSTRYERVANLLEKEKGHEPGDDRESRRYGTREEIRVLLQKLAVAEQIREPFRRTRKCAPNDGPIPNTRSGIKEADSILRMS